MKHGGAYIPAPGKLNYDKSFIKDLYNNPTNY